ncbi:MAG: thioredoxin family protein [Bacteroidales bacterium]|nr:thioredoxin family protein [Bacteroidales bacterium]
MNIKILGTGCPKCNQLEQLVKEAVQALSINAEITKVEDIDKILSYGIMRTPALVINEKVVMYGRVPSVQELKELIEKNQ